jgi:hypothetical protein
MNVKFPVPPGVITQDYIIKVLDVIRNAFVPALSKNESVPRVLLSAPNGKVYEVMVDNTGNLTTALNDGKTRDI